MDVIHTAQFIHCYVVRRIKNVSPYASYRNFVRDKDGKVVPTPEAKEPEDITEVFLTESRAQERSLELSHCSCKVTVNKHIGLTVDNGENVAVISAINTLRTSQ